jgi:hypothetical protein
MATITTTTTTPGEAGVVDVLVPVLPRGSTMECATTMASLANKLTSARRVARTTIPSKLSTPATLNRETSRVGLSSGYSLPFTLEPFVYF